MEIGSPMASLYLLGNPDHYTSHIFVPFWWRSYVNEVCRGWPDLSEELPSEGKTLLDEEEHTEFDSDSESDIDSSAESEDSKALGGGPPELESDMSMSYEENINGSDTSMIYEENVNKDIIDDSEQDLLFQNTSTTKQFDNNNPTAEMKSNTEEDDPDKVVLLRQQNNYVGQSNVDDYVYRPDCYNVLNLYQWIQTSSKRKRPKRKQKKTKVEDDSDISEDGDSSDGNSEDESEKDWEDTNLEDIIKYQRFSLGHPLHETHEVICDMNKINTIVPNILGGALPRSDSGDREFYCMTMLTLFKPWRLGKMLKEEGQTWDQAFLAYRFKNRVKEIMNNFNLRYECLDARDDFHSALKKKNRKFGLHTDNDFENTYLDSDSGDSDSGEYNTLEDDTYEEAGPVHLKTHLPQNKLTRITQAMRHLKMILQQK